MLSELLSKAFFDSLPLGGRQFQEKFFIIRTFKGSLKKRKRKKLKRPTLKS